MEKTPIIDVPIIKGEVPRWETTPRDF